MNEYMTKYADVMTELAQFDETTFSPTDMKYYAEVYDRIFKKNREAF